MRNLNLPGYDFRMKDEGGQTLMFDPFRRKYVVFTPEEEVRQRFAHYLMAEKDFPASLIMIEHGLKLNKMAKRCDILVHKPAGVPAVLVECKAPEVKITGNTFDQIARYNLAFRVRYLMVTNGLKHYCAAVDFESREIKFVPEIPSYASL